MRGVANDCSDIESILQGAHARVEVNFETAGTKWLVLSYANLDLM